ncbi:MAG: outer membrane beta-barrel domain-containing protein [Desulfuromonadaceae bacterium]
MKKLIGSIVVAGLIASTTVAFGAVKEGSFSVTPLIGGYMFDGEDTLDSTFLLGIRAGYNFTKNIGVEALYDYATETDGKSVPMTDISMQRFGGQALYHFFPDNVFVPYLAAGYSGVKFDGNGINNSTHGAFDYGVGAKYFVTDDIALRGDLRHIIYKYDSGTYNDMEYTLGAYFQFGGTKPAMKPIAAEPAPKPAPKPVTPVAVVAAPADSDRDKVIDAMDNCPGTPTGVAVDAQGCPVDSDRDGVADYLDKCLGTAAGVTVDNKGCPLDTDNDGVADYLDKCPTTPAGAAVDANGCPLDTDNDGVADYMDKCPTTPLGTAVDAHGCAIEAAARFCDKPAVIAISFDTNKTDVKAKYYEELDKLGNFLKEYPDSKGTIEGHTDSDGSKQLNQKLSQARAENVRSYIIKKFGIEDSRVSAIGYGSAKPVASNKTAAGKAKNRRTEAVFTCQ